MVPSCLIRVVWMERNRHSFEAKEKLLIQLRALCQSTLYDWSTGWSSSNCSSILRFLLLLELSLKLFFISLLFFVVVSCVHHHEHLVFAVFVFSS